MTHRSLEELVTSVATRLMAVDSSTFPAAADELLAEVVEHLDIDLAFLRHHDPVARTSTLVAEHPRRTDVPDPDPLGVIAFADADPIFASTEHLARVGIVRPDPRTAAYQERVAAASGVPQTSAATVPLRSGTRTTGILGLVKFGDRVWTGPETNALQAIGALLAQLQARLEAEDRLRRMAHHDELTGLANRRALLEHLEARNVVGAPGPLAILFLDVDRLKAMNDFLGHAAGDRFIRAVGERLRDRACPADLVARLGGDEFVVVLAGPADLATALATAGRAREVVNEPLVLGEQELGRSVSIGVAVAEPGSRSVSEWLRHADEAAMAAKARGGNAIRAYSDEMAAANSERTDIELHLRSAIHDGSLVLHYQPTVALVDGTITGVEALVRWHHPTRGLLNPEQFVDVAEATNIAGELGQWVLAEACRQLAAWRAADPTLSLRLSVNVSPVQLVSPTFVDRVADALERHDLPATDLVLEITEHAVVGDLPRVTATLWGLRALGVGLAIDDFGTGYSSLAQLKALPVTTLKIDRGFVTELGTNPDDHAIVTAIVALAAAFSLSLVAEGVETALAADTLLELGCEAAQGYLFSTPVPADELAVLLAGGPLVRSAAPHDA